jgi:hypothetical protein
MNEVPASLAKPDRSTFRDIVGTAVGRGHGDRSGCSRFSGMRGHGRKLSAGHSGHAHRPARADHSRRAFRNICIGTPVFLVSDRETVTTGPLTLRRNSGGCFPMKLARKDDRRRIRAGLVTRFRRRFTGVGAS